MADVEDIVFEIVNGLIDNSRVNNVTLADGWDADLAISIYYLDAEMGYNAALQAEHGIPTDQEYTAIKHRIATFLAANRGWWFWGETRLIDA